MPEALSKAAGTISGLATGLGKTAFDAFKSAGTFVTPGSATMPTVTATSTGAGSIPTITAQTGNLTGATATTVTPKAAFLNAGAKVLGAAAALHGGIESIATADAAGRAPLSAGDLLNSASRNTEYINGVGYDTYGGYDVTGAKKYLKDFNKANIIKQATSGMEFGAGVGSFFGPLGTGIGSFIGTLGGLGVGLFNSGKAKEKMERVMDNTDRAIAGYNLQNEAEAANKAAKNSYYASHYAPADEGSNVGEKPNALVNNREVLGTVKNGRV